MKSKNILTSVVLGLLYFSCSSRGTTTEKITSKEIENTTNTEVSSSKTMKWDFESLEGWQDATQSGDINNYIDKGNLRIFTKANSWDRSKINTTTTYTTGIYSWKIFTPKMGVGDMASIGAFLYNSAGHELDFEIGYSKHTLRNQMNAEPDDLVVHMNSQENPERSFKSKIKRGQWHVFSIQLDLDLDKNYKAVWMIDNKTIAKTALNYGTEKRFEIYCSVENLTFIGEHIPTKQNYALFDYVSHSVN